MSRVAKLPIRWDGSDIGEIQPLISETIPSTSLMVLLKDGTKVSITKDLGTICLIADELKPLFDLDKIGRVYCTYRGQKAMLHRVYEEYPLLDCSIRYNREEVKKVFVFRWFLGLIQSYERVVLIRKYKSGITKALSYMDKDYDYEKETHFGSVIPNTIITKWFDGDFDDIAKQMIKHKNFIQLRKSINEVIERIDIKHNMWGFLICYRLNTFLPKEDCYEIPKGLKFSSITSREEVPTADYAEYDGDSKQVDKQGDGDDDREGDGEGGKYGPQVIKTITLANPSLKSVSGFSGDLSRFAGAINFKPESDDERDDDISIFDKKKPKKRLVKAACKPSEVNSDLGDGESYACKTEHKPMGIPNGGIVTVVPTVIDKEAIQMELQMRRDQIQASKGTGVDFELPISSIEAPPGAVSADLPPFLTGLTALDTQPSTLLGTLPSKPPSQELSSLTHVKDLEAKAEENEKENGKEKENENEKESDCERDGGDSNGDKQDGDPKWVDEGTYVKCLTKVFTGLPPSYSQDMYYKEMLRNKDKFPPLPSPHSPPRSGSQLSSPISLTILPSVPSPSTYLGSPSFCNLNSTGFSYRKERDEKGGKEDNGKERESPSQVQYECPIFRDLNFVHYSYLTKAKDEKALSPKDYESMVRPYIGALRYKGLIGMRVPISPQEYFSSSLPYFLEEYDVDFTNIKILYFKDNVQRIEGVEGIRKTQSPARRDPDVILKLPDNIRDLDLQERIALISKLHIPSPKRGDGTSTQCEIRNRKLVSLYLRGVIEEHYDKFEEVVSKFVVPTNNGYAYKGVVHGDRIVVPLPPAKKSRMAHMPDETKTFAYTPTKSDRITVRPKIIRTFNEFYKQSIEIQKIIKERKQSNKR